MIWTGVSEKSGESYFYSVSARIRSLARAAAPRRARGYLWVWPHVHVVSCAHRISDLTRSTRSRRGEGACDVSRGGAYSWCADSDLAQPLKR